MSRPPKQPRREDIPAEERPDYDAVVARARRFAGAGDGPVEEHFDAGEYFGALLNSPPMTAIAARMGTFVRTVGNSGNSYSHADREFVDQVLSADWKTNVVQGIHVADAVGAGVRLEAIEALRYGHEEDLNEDEQLLAKFIRQVVSGTVDDETYSRIENRLGTRGLVEYAGFVLWLQWIMRMMQTLGTADLPEAEVDRIIAELRAGTNKDIDYESRLV